MNKQFTFTAPTPQLGEVHLCVEVSLVVTCQKNYFQICLYAPQLLGQDFQTAYGQYSETFGWFRARKGLLNTLKVVGRYEFQPQYLDPDDLTDCRFNGFCYDTTTREELESILWYVGYDFATYYQELAEDYAQKCQELAELSPDFSSSDFNLRVQIGTLTTEVEASQTDSSQTVEYSLLLRARA